MNTIILNKLHNKLRILLDIGHIEHFGHIGHLDIHIGLLEFKKVKLKDTKHFF